MSKGFLNVDNLSKIFNTLFEENEGMFYKRNYNINNKSILSLNENKIGSIEDILNKEYLEENTKSIISNKKNAIYTFEVNSYKIIFKEKINKEERKKLEEVGSEYPGEHNTIIIYFIGKNIDTLNYIKAENLMFNITKHKYVPYIELIDSNENIEINKIAKIKTSDPLVKFYGYNKNNICKIIYKSKKINTINLYFNYRLIV